MSGRAVFGRDWVGVGRTLVLYAIDMDVEGRVEVGRVDVGRVDIVVGSQDASRPSALASVEWRDRHDIGPWRNTAIMRMMSPTTSLYLSSRLLYFGRYG